MLNDKYQNLMKHLAKSLQTDNHNLRKNVATNEIRSDKTGLFQNF